MLISSSDKQQDGNVQERLYHMYKYQEHPYVNFFCIKFVSD